MKRSYKLLNSIFRLFKSLDKKRKYQFLGILFINIFNGLFEFISIGSALLFIESLTNPNKISSTFSFLFSTFNIENDRDLISLSTIIFLIIIFLTTLIRIFNLWLNTKFRISFLNYISNKVYKRIINQEYYFFVNSNSSELLTDLTSNIEKKTNFFFENLLTLTTSIILSFSIILSLIKLNFYITFSSVIFFSTIYTFLGIIINKRVETYSKLELKSSYKLTKIIQDSLNAIKEIIISNSHEFYEINFKKNDINLRTYQGVIGFITTFPRYLFEGIGLLFLGISGYVIYFSLDNSANIIALLGAFALGAQKLLPTMQSSYKSWSLLYFYNKPLDRILELLKLNSNKTKSTKDKLLFKDRIKISNLSFGYANNDDISKNINLTIAKGENLGIFGKTGSGKTTLINILMGILTPKKGNIFVDDTELFNLKKNHLLKKWKNNIALVPQDVFLFDGSILENIAFCIRKEDIDFKRVINAAKIACADEFIIKTDHAYNTYVGDKGIKLSGGQKQRIGLARAIYTNSDLLILDESTSALDFKTEKSVIESIFNKNSNPNLTTITIAHRLSTLRYCDKIIEIKDGSIKGLYNNREYVEKFKNLFKIFLI